MQPTTEAKWEPKKSAFEGVTLYHWMVVLIASCGWLFDCMDQRLFTLARESALKELLGNDAAAQAAIKTYIGYSISCMMLGWATGGVVFGILSDKIGRVRTMMITLFIYSGFTGLSGLSHTWYDFYFYRFLVGIGVGGMFSAATTLVAESVPGQIRSIALGSLQALSAIGNMLGSFISYHIPPGQENYWGSYMGWRVLFFVGIIPSLLVIPIVFFLKEPEVWVKAKEAARLSTQKSVGSISDLVTNPRWRRNLVVGLMLGTAGMIGLWGIGFWSPELISTALQGRPQPEIDRYRSLGTLLQDVGSLLGMMAFTYVATYMSRRVAFFFSFILCILATDFVFLSLRDPSDTYWMLPMMGFAQLAVFAGYSIYFPELFPTRLRGTGVSLCYNAVRIITAFGVPMLGYLTIQLREQGYAEPFRVAAVIMSSIFLLGIVALIWAPETKGQPLPED